MKAMPFSPLKFRRRVFVQLWMLALQFILGMIVNLIGEEATGLLHTIYVIVLWMHILTAIGLIEGAVYIVLKEKSRLAWWIVGLLMFTLLSGVITMITKQEMWSFIMSLGFVASAWTTGMLYVRADRLVHSQKSTGK